MKDQAYSFAWYEILALGWDFDRRYADGIRAVTADQVQEAAQALLGGLLIALAMPME
jgi:predicted Zn-dependent peptidase